MDKNQGIQVRFNPVGIGRASEEIVLQVEAAIMDGRLAPGERLPSEREMQTQFGIGRGVVREAIKTLKQKGLLEVRKGAKGGAYVRELEVSNVSESLALFLKQHPVAPEKLIEFRETIDRTITELAIARADRTEKEKLLEDAMRLETLLRQDDPDLTVTGELDRQLNISLVKMARNPLLEWVMHAVQMGFSSHDYALYEDAGYREKAAANWSDTARAICNDEPMRALSFIGYHYVLLRKCVEERNGQSQQDLPFLNESPNNK
ncbi:FadR/GntR family transcriptional regulator [Pseudodesulfovibrio senegalensis]|uniref:FadR family transcriptional regulator n=1 Tax=Pseudodesulfovibrio senegalensis TaxID=1721087 RepID=A0A6N6N3B9_9BACT|nr:GntR family transcriptional regulator [Pseudodesulfovibrio senegalensis]KAB1442202.1 FadR family transcriptional regulator [Pseudodesulfovibrio senegalensis]